MKEVLGQGWRYFIAGFKTAFPWVLAAELLPALAGLFVSDNLLLTILLGLAQAFLYGMAVCALARLGGMPQASPVRTSYRAIPAVFIGYLLYELIIGAGLVISLSVFVIIFLSAGELPALIACIVPLAPTAAVSTALAFFAYPAVLEKGGPFTALGESWRRAMGGWMQATAVVSVPALVLAGVWLGENGAATVSGVEQALQQISTLSTDLSTEQLQALLSASESTAPERSGVLHLAWSAVGAIAWWYTLATCYAQYQSLKARAAERRPAD